MLVVATGDITSPGLISAENAVSKPVIVLVEDAWSTVTVLPINDIDSFNANDAVNVTVAEVAGSSIQPPDVHQIVHS